MRINWRKVLWNLTGLVQLSFLIAGIVEGAIVLMVPISQVTPLLIVVFIGFGLIWFLMRKVRRPFKDRYSLFSTSNPVSLGEYIKKRYPILGSFIDQKDENNKLQ